MTLYELIKQISEILTPESNLFYDYVLHTSDDNGGFLRTRYCWWEKPIKNRNLGEKKYKKVLVSMRKPFAKSELTNRGETLVKMQIHYGETDASIKDAEWDSDLGYCHIYIFDLENKSYSMTPFV